MDLSLSYFVNVSVAQVSAGVSAFNTSNIALISREPYQASFGVGTYKIYKSPQAVGVDFGTNSNTFKMANAIFSQNPNILTNGGYLTIIPYLNAETYDAAISRMQNIVQFFGVLPVELVDEADGLASAAVIQAMQKISFLTSATPGDVLPGGYLDLIRSSGYTQSRALYFGITAVTAVQTILFSSLPTTGTYELSYNGNPTAAIAHDANAAAVQAALRLVAGLGTITVLGAPAQGFQVTFTGIDGDALLLAVAANSLEDANTNAVQLNIQTAVVGFSVAQALTQILINSASYAGRALSTNFSGSNTTQNMHGKSLIGAMPDPSMTDTLIAQCGAAGADVYATFADVPAVFTSGKNRFFDQVYNQLWFANAAGVAYANVILQNSTKIAQTEDGVLTLKSAVRKVATQAVKNQYVAPGAWTDPNTFGVLEDFYSNIASVGYYIYTQPISQQSPADRAARDATLMQIALKEAGGTNSGNIIININP